MSFKRNLIICTLFFVILMCCSTAVSASDDSSNITLTSDNIENVVSNEEIEKISENDVEIEDIAGSDSSDDDTIYVDSSNNNENQNGSKLNPYSNINEAMLQVSDGGTIFIKNGNYSVERMELNKGMSIIGESKNGVNLLSNYLSNVNNLLTFNLNNNSLLLQNITFKSIYDYKFENKAPLVVNGEGKFSMDNCSWAFTWVECDVILGINESYISNTDFTASVRYQGAGNHFVDNVNTNGIAVLNASSIVDVYNSTFLNSYMLNDQNYNTFGSNYIMNYGILNIRNSRFKNIKMADHIQGIITNDGNLSITSCVINNCNAHSFIHERNDLSIKFNYNVFNSCVFDDEILKLNGNNDDLEYNWWENNCHPYNVSEWIYLNSSLEKSDKVIVVSTLKYTDGENYTNVDNNVFDNVEIKVKSSELTLDTIATFDNGIIKMEFIPIHDTFVSINNDLIHLSIGDIYVDSNFEGEELGTITNPYKTLSSAINNASAFDTIHIKNGKYNEESILITKSLNIIGESKDNVIITGDNNGIFSTPIYMTNNIDLLFSNLTVVNVTCTGMNTAISIGSIVNDLIIVDCTFNNCTGQYGSLSISSQSALIKNCNILNSKTNAQDGGTGAIYFSGDGEYSIINTFINNTINNAEYMYGVIYVDNYNSAISLYNTTILNTNGLAISVINSKGQISIKQSKIQDNSLIKTDFDDGIFYVSDDANITITETIIFNNNNYDYLIFASENSNVKVNYNVIHNNVKNVLNKQEDYDLDYNWWGTNDQPNNFTDKWVILQYDSYDMKYGYLYVNLEFNHYMTLDGEIYDIGRIAGTYYNVNVNFPNTGIEFKFKILPLNLTLVAYSNAGIVSTKFLNEGVESVDVLSITSTILNIDVNNFKSKKIYVDASNPNEGNGTIDNPYKDITKAFKDVEGATEIFVKNGSYSYQRQSFTFSSDVSIIGESKQGVAIKNSHQLGSDTFILDGIILSITNVSFTQNTFEFKGDGEVLLDNCCFNNSYLSTSANILKMVDSEFDKNYKLTIQDGMVEFDNVKIMNYASDRVYNPIEVKGNLTIKNSVIENNKITKKVNLITGINSFILSNGGNVILDNCSIINNQIFSNIVANSKSEGVIIVKNSIIQDNTFHTSRKNGYEASVIYGGSNGIIESALICNNGGLNYLIYNSGSTSNYNVSYNAIYDNVYSKGIAAPNGINNLDYNWWGDNAPTYADANTWIILDAYYAPIDLISGENVTVTATLKHYITKDGGIGEVTKFVPIGDMNITFTLADGTVLNKTTENSETSFTYTINKSESVLVQAENIEFELPITLKALRIVLEDTYIPTEDANITILAPSIDTIEVYVDGKKETLQVIDGKAVKTIENIQAGKHSVVVIYNDGTTFDFDSKSFTVDKLQTQINLEDVTVNVGQTVPVEFTIASDATGRVFIDVSGKKFFEYLEDGSLSIDLDLAIGNYTVTLYYEGDGKYDACKDSFNITVNGFNADLKANASDIKVGENAIIDIEINENATGATNVILGDLIIPVIFIDGKATVSIPDLANGTYTATVKFAGDSIFLAAETTVTFTVSKEELPSDINITIDIPEGTTAPEFTVNLPSDATGDFSVTIDNQTYYQPLVNGSATVKVPEQTPGNHTVSTAYTGDGKYDGFTSPNSTFNVPKASIPGGENALNMTTPADSATPSYSIKLPADAKGNLTVTVDGKDTYSKELVNGSATVTVPELPAGKHNITVSYSGDAKYSSISKNTTVNVAEKAKPAPAKTTKVATKITAKNKKFKASKKVKKYTITLKSGKKPVNKVQVTLKIKGKTYKAKTNAKGKATFKIKKLTKKGKYSAVIKFAGNKNYKATSKKVKITVKK